MAPPTIPVVDSKIVYTVCPAIASIVTIIRLWMRANTARLWWDDALAFVSMIFIILTAAGGWMHFDAQELDSNVTKVAAYYIVAQAFYGTLWCARLSILYSIIRIASSPQMRKFLHFLGAAFAFAWLLLFCQIWWVCIPMHNHWQAAVTPQCPLTLQVAVVQLVSDILADLSLIAVPARLFVNSQLEVGQKMRLVVIFSASILTTVVSLVHAYYILRVGGSDVLIAAIVEIAVSLIVCNLSVLVTACSRSCGSKKSRMGEDSDRIPVSIPSWRNTKKSRQGELTTIGLTTLGQQTEINVQKESTTFIDSASENGKIKTIDSGDGPTTFYPADDNGKKIYLQPEPANW